MTLRLCSGQAGPMLALALVLSAAPAFAQAEAEWTAGDRREEARPRWEPSSRDGVHVRMLRDYYLPADATAREPVIVLGGDATIDGRTDDDVVVIGGTLRVGPRAVIAGEVVTIGRAAIIDPAATIRGGVDNAVIVWPNVDWSIDWPVRGWRGWWPAAALSATVLRLGLVLIVALVLTIVAPGWIRSMGVRASSAISSGLIGAVAEILFVPALIAVVLALTISLIGIPLLGAIPFALALGALAWTGGFAAVSACLGARLRGSSIARSSSLVTDLVIGFAVISALSIVAHVLSLGAGWMTPLGWMTRAAGMAVEYLAWTIGLGALISGRVVRSRATAPPVPARSAVY